MNTTRIAIRVSIALIAASFFTGCQEEPAPEPVDFVEDQYERYVEHYDEAVGPLEAWVYDSDDALKEYTVFNYTSGLNTELLVYNSDEVVDDTTLISKVLYTYDADGNTTHAELYNKVDGVMTKEAYFDAMYNAQGNYLDYLEYDGSDAVVEHRVCTYDGTGENYLVETYYADEGTAVMIEEYRCTYDPADASKWIQEDHFLLVSAESDDSTNDDTDYSRTMVYTYTWNGDNMYLQSDFDETGRMVVAIMYTFDVDRPATRSYLNEDGKLILYRTYQYDEAGDLIELRYYNYNNAEGDELEVREAYRLYTSDGKSMYERKITTYDYTSRSATGATLGSSASRLQRPEDSHHRGD